MSEVAITVENLSKSYLVGHRSDGQGHYKYTALRDVIGRELRNFARKAGDVFRGRQVIQGDEIEEFWALKDVSFEVKEGEVLGIIGRNGAGKSTLLKILSRITEPTEGRIVLRGRVGSLLEVGTGFHPELTGRENIFLNGAILGMSQREIRKKFDEIVAFAEVEKFLDTPVKRYSSGMYVRLAFAVAAHLDTEILVVDEVLAVGDMDFQKKCLGKMSEVARGGRTILFVSHNHAAIRNLCSHGLVLNAGRALPKQEIRSVLDQYSAERQMTLESSWTHPANLKGNPVHFEFINVRLDGQQPRHTLLCNVATRWVRDARPALMGIVILDRTSTPIMQITPNANAFIGGMTGVYQVDIMVELPPLIPGVYGLDFWIGPAYTETYDFVKLAVAIEIVDSPTVGRTFPDTSEHGYIVPISTASVRKAAGLASLEAK
jgi:lipopolysaccharide transport system ATP-binding protein